MLNITILIPKHTISIMFHRDILKQNGTAVDAAIAALVCNGAVHSQSMGLGGGFFMTIYNKSQSMAYFLDAREVAPLYATENMYEDKTVSTEKGLFLPRLYLRIE